MAKIFILAGHRRNAEDFCTTMYVYPLRPTSSLPVLPLAACVALNGTKCCQRIDNDKDPLGSEGLLLYAQDILQ